MRLRRQDVFALFNKRLAEASTFAKSIQKNCVLNVRLVEDNPKKYPRRRNFAQTDGTTIYVAPKFFYQDLSRIDALIRHELAHTVFMLFGLHDHSEAETDELAELIWKQNIYYDDEDVQTLNLGTRPRPVYLPQ